MVITLTGGNSFTLRQRLSQLVSNFVAEQGELALERIEAQDKDLQGIIEAVQSLPFLANRKMVVVRDLSANKPAAEAIEQIISSTLDSTDLIIVEPSPDKRTAYFKVLKKQTQLDEFIELEPGEMARWLVNEAKNGGGNLSLSDANYLVERVGANQQMLAMELEKLLTYHPDISRSQIDLLTEPAPQSKVFDLLDAAFSGDKKRALRLYDDQRAQKVEPQAILAMIGWQLGLMTIAKAGKGRNAAEIAKDAGLNPYPVTKAMGLVSRMEDTKLQDLVHQALEMDWLSKTSPLDMDEALRTYIITI